MKHSPLDAKHKALGAKMADFGGWEMPLSYEAGTLDEHLACRHDAVVFDVSNGKAIADTFEISLSSVQKQPMQER